MTRKSFAALTEEQITPTTSEVAAEETVKTAAEGENVTEETVKTAAEGETMEMAEEKSVPEEASNTEEATHEEEAAEVEEESSVKLETEQVEVPEDATELEAKVYLTDSGDLMVIPAEPLEIEGVSEPITQLEIEIHSEEEAEMEMSEDIETEAPAMEEASTPEETHEEAPAPASMETVSKEEDKMTEAMAYESMTELNSAEISMVKAGTTSNPAWLVLKNGSVFATIDLESQENKEGKYFDFFASSEFPARVKEAAASIGWNEVLPRMKAKLHTDKGVALAPVFVSTAELKEQLRQELFNDAQIAYSAMKARLRENPIAVNLFDAASKAGIPQAEVFTAGVLADPKGEFITALFDATEEVNNMHPEVKGEFKKLIARTQVPIVTTQTPEYTPDSDFMARLASSSLPVAPANGSSVPNSSRFSGIL